MSLGFEGFIWFLGMIENIIYPTVFAKRKKLKPSRKRPSPPQPPGVPRGLGGIAVKLRKITARQDGPHPPSPLSQNVRGGEEHGIELHGA